MGKDAYLRHASRNEVGLALAIAEVDPELQLAILAKDQPQLEILLGTGQLYCAQCPDKDDEEEDDDTEEKRSPEGGEMNLRDVFRATASVG